MRAFSLLAGCVMLTAVMVVSPFAAENRFVKVKKSFANIYEYLDPQSKIVRQAKKGDYFELVYEGTSWYQVKVADKVGWLERRAGNVVENQTVTILSVPVGTFLVFVILLVFTFIGTSLFIYRQKTAEL
jgi:hypothetical protein